MKHKPVDVARMLELQANRWALGHRPAEPKPGAHGMPCITISRQYGARGGLVGWHLAERLGLGYWNRDLLAAMAEQSRLRPELLAALDEHTRSDFEAAVRGALSGLTVTESDYRQALVAAVAAIRSRDAAVFVGRGIGFILDPAVTLRVRVVAPLAWRVAGLVDRGALGPGAPQKAVRAVDDERTAFVRRHFGHDIADAQHYDLVVNTGALGPEGAVEVILRAFEVRFGTTRSTGQRAVTGASSAPSR